MLRKYLPDSLTRNKSAAISAFIHNTIPWLMQLPSSRRLDVAYCYSFRGIDLETVGYQTVEVNIWSA